MPQAELADLVKRIGQAIKEAQEHIEHLSITTFGSYFVEDGQEGDPKKTLRPRMIKLPLPDLRGGYVEREIPIVSLVNHNTLDLDEVRIKMHVTGSCVNELSDPQKLKLLVNFEPIRDKIDDDKKAEVNYTSIELIFKRGEPPEGTARVLNEMNKSIA